MAPKSASKKNCGFKLAREAVEWADRVVCEAVKFDAIEDYVSQVITEMSQVIQDMSGEAGVDYGIHKIDERMGKILWKTEMGYA